MPKGLRRRYGHQHLHFITCSCYRRLPLLASVKARNALVKILGEVRDRYRFQLAGYVVMPEHIHLLFSEPPGATPSKVMQVLKQRVSRRLRRRRRTQPGPAQLRLPLQEAQDSLPHFWQSRFYDFNVWSRKKFIEKLHYMHMNPLKRKLVTHPGLAVEQFHVLCQEGPVLNSHRSDALNGPERMQGEKAKTPPFHKPERWGTRKFKTA